MYLLDPKIDIIFKIIFSEESIESKKALINLLNSIIKPKDLIVDVIYKNPYTTKEYKQQKESIMDIKVITQANELIDIEMQINDVDSFKKRALTLWSNIYSTQLEKGEAYEENKKCIFISILDFNLIKENEDWHSKFVILEADKKFEFLEDLQMHFLELKKFKVFKDSKEIPRDTLARWMAFFKYADDESMRDLLEKIEQAEEGIAMAGNILRKVSQDEKARALYEDRMTWLRDTNSNLKRAERQGIEQGLKQGLEQGIEQGLKQGLKQGEFENAKKVARNLLKTNMSLEQISEITGLTVKEIESL